MVKYARVGLSGLLISFLGALPFGTLNLTAFDISASQGINAALWFALAVVLVELVMVRLTLYGSERLQIGERTLQYLLPLGILLLWYLSWSSYRGAFMDPVNTNGDMVPVFRSTFVLGLLLSGLNPLQLPFWFSWNTFLENKGILKKTIYHYSFYLVGIGSGTFLAMGVFIVMGRYLFEYHAQYNMVVNIIMGTLYLGFSFYLMYQFIKKRNLYKLQ